MNPDLRRALLEPLRELIQAEIAEAMQGRNPYVRLGTIPGDYVSGKPQVRFDGDTEPSGTQYEHLASYTPSAGDRVVLERIGSTWVIMGTLKVY